MKVEFVGGKEAPSGGLLAVAHLSVHEAGLRLNLEATRKIVFYASENNVSTIVLPYMQPYGPIIQLYDVIRRDDLRKFFALTRESSYINTLVTLSDHYGVSIVLPGYFERVSSKIYVSTAFTSWELEEGLATRRKLVLNEKERRLGLSKGVDLPMFVDKGLVFNTLIEDELFYPEIARFITENNANLLIVALPQVEPPKNYIELSKSLALIYRVWVLVPGSRFVRRDGTVYALPTIMINPEGEIIYKHYGLEEAFIVIAKGLLRSAPRTIGLNSRTFYRLYRHLYKRYSIYGGVPGEGGAGQTGQPS
ncbi:carbon-nitrogen hydrolase family protein [Thermogladius sp. KZ2Tp1]|uniref:carbon-nitrogen hydrolase family protein n=1 Tax=Thermogladius sp. KZ2Tp1 TaxID=3136289 RepID=UPI003DA95E83